MQNRLLITEAVGFGVAGKITDSLNNPVASKVFETGSSLAGTSSLVFGAGNVLGSLSLLEPKKGKKWRW